MPTASNFVRSFVLFGVIARLITPAIAQESPVVSTSQSLADLESVASDIDLQLSELAKLLKSPEPIDAEHVISLGAPAIRCESLRPATELVYRSDQVQISRAIESPSKQQPHPLEHSGHDGLADALNHAKAPMIGLAEVHLKFKTVKLETEDNTIQSKVVVHFSAKSANQVVEQSAHWQMDWSFENSKTPMLLRIRVTDFEEVKTHSSHGQWFVDCTEAVFADNASFQEQLRYGSPHWRSTLTEKLEIAFEGHIGVTVADVNNDGREDVFVCQPLGLPNRLYLQQPDGSLVDTSAQAGLDFLDSTWSALFLDFDNDGDQDLACAVTGQVVFLANDGQGRFDVRCSAKSPTRTYSICAADYDQDGDLDVYACGYIRHADFKDNPLKALFAVPTPYHDARNGAPNVLLRNDGDLQFVDVTTESGLDAGNDRFSHAAIWEDFDNDGDQDLYVANDFGRNNFYRNDNGTFADVSVASQTEDIANGMGLTVQDFDKDGWMDIYVSNMFSAAGNRTTQHQSFKSKSNDEVRGAFRRLARGNTLFRNLGDGTFDDVSEAASVTLGRWAWSSNFVDMNNNGWHDLFVCNGYITNENTRDL